MNFLSTGRSRVRSIKCCVLFDPSDGAIRHAHRVITMEGVDETPAQRIEERTSQLARRLGVDVAGLQLLHVDAATIEPNQRYIVDVGRRCLVPIKSPTDETTQPNRIAKKKLRAASKRAARKKRC
jgi:hypothetical protein